MKKLLLMSTLLFAVLSTSAQDVKKDSRRSKNTEYSQRTPEQRAEAMTKRMTEQLSLTKEQQEKVYQLSLKQAQTHIERSQNKRAKIQEMKEENQKRQEEIKSILTPEQQSKWTELKREQMKSRNGRARSNGKDFKRKPGMIKKADSVQSRRPVKKITPVVQ